MFETRRWLLSLTLLFFIGFTAHAIEPSDFAAEIIYQDVKISPDGKHVAVAVLSEGKRSLVILDTKGFQKVGGALFAEQMQVGEYHWVSSERLVIKVLEKEPWESEPRYYGELFGIDYDGDNGEFIFGYRASSGMQTGSRLKKKESTRGWAEIINTLPGDDKHILIANEPYSDDFSMKAELQKLNVYSGRLSNPVSQAPIAGADIITNKDGKLFFAFGLDASRDPHLYLYDEKEEIWQPFSQINFGSDFVPLAMDDTSENFYYLNNHEKDKQGLYKYSMASGESSHIYTDKNVDITHVKFTTDDTGVYGLRIDTGYPEYLIFDKTIEEAKTFRSLLATFPGLEVRVTSRSLDNTKWVIFVSSDTSSGAFYYYDKAAGNISMLFKQLESLPSKAMAQMTPIEFSAQDGETIRGYLTKPNGSKNAPLVTLVHGGPHNIRDYWGFDQGVQMLANEGYAVLQVNFRGSGGYGHAFESAGFQEWGGISQQDIIDGTKWAMTQEGISKESACIVGGSFGGYSAAQSAILAPELFKCVVATAAVFDLEMMFEEGDITERYDGEAYLEQALGMDKEKLKDFSPVNNVSKLQAPMLIVHGEKDRRVPIEQAEAMREAMDKAGKPYIWHINPSESHGFYNPDNRAEYFEKVANFLAKHLK